MDAPQLVLLGVGGLLMVGGGAGIVFFAEEGAELPYAVTFATRTQPIELPDDAWSAPSSTLAFRVTRLNVTEVAVTVACSDPSPTGAANAATVTVRVEGPNGLSGEESGPCGQNLEVRVPTAQVPADTTSPGTSPENAVENLPESFTQTNATGDWSVEVSVARAQPLPAPGGDPAGTVAVAVTSYEASAQPATVR